MCSAKANSNDSNPLYKLLVLGDGGVGKTALTIQLCLHHFVETYDPTIEDSYRKQVQLDDESATLEVLDTAGQEEYTALRDQWIRDGEGVLLIYSITSRSSFTRLKNYFQQIERVKDEEPFALVLVGNKLDRDSERQVSHAEGARLAKELGDVPFFECSAKQNINIETAFYTLARKCRLLRHPEQKSKLEPLILKGMGNSNDNKTDSNNSVNTANLSSNPKSRPEMTSKKKKKSCLVM